MKKPINKKGFTLIEVMFYVAILIVIVVLSFNTLKLVTSMTNDDTTKLKFYAEKNQVYAYLSEHAKSINSSSIRGNKELSYEVGGQPITISLTDKGLNIIGNGRNEMYETITDFDVRIINEVCYEENSTITCKNTKNLLQVILSSNKENNDKLQMNNSRRLFYIGSE